MGEYHSGLLVKSQVLGWCCNIRGTVDDLIRNITVVCSKLEEKLPHRHVIHNVSKWVSKSSKVSLALSVHLKHFSGEYKSWSSEWWLQWWHQQAGDWTHSRQWDNPDLREVDSLRTQPRPASLMRRLPAPDFSWHQMAMILSKGKTSTTFPNSAIFAMTVQVNKNLSSRHHQGQGRKIKAKVIPWNSG